MAEVAGYLGRNRFLRWWPKLLLVLAVIILVVNTNHGIQWATLLAVIAYVHGRWLPWQFAIHDDGLTLTFPFGRRLFLPRSRLTVRIEVVGAVAMVGRRRHFGYLLMDRIGYEPNDEERLRRCVHRLRLQPAVAAGSRLVRVRSRLAVFARARAAGDLPESTARRSSRAAWPRGARRCGRHRRSMPTSSAIGRSGCGGTRAVSMCASTSSPKQIEQARRRPPVAGSRANSAHRRRPSRRAAQLGEIVARRVAAARSSASSSAMRRPSSLHGVHCPHDSTARKRDTPAVDRDEIVGVVEHDEPGRTRDRCRSRPAPRSSAGVSSASPVMNALGHTGQDRADACGRDARHRRSPR